MRLLKVFIIVGCIVSCTELLSLRAETLSSVVRGSDFSFYLNEAEAGDSEGMRRVAVCYQTGSGVEKDLRKAWEWYGKSAAAGNTEAQYDIGTLYRDGIGTARNYKEAAYWFRKAASNGHPKAMINIARQFAEGQGVL